MSSPRGTVDDTDNQSKQDSAQFNHVRPGLTQPSSFGKLKVIKMR